MNPSTLFVSDLDGTLLDCDARLSAGSARLLNDAIGRGAMFTVATARTPATVDPIMAPVDMKLPAIVMTGAAWWRFDTRSYDNVSYIGRDDTAVLLELFRRCGVTPFVYTLRDNRLDVFFDRTDPAPADRAFIEARRGLELKTFVFSPVGDDRRRSCVLFFASGDKAVLERLDGDIRAATGCATSCYDDIYNPGLGLIEVFAPGVSKANALEAMRRHYGPERLVVFGDNLNDLPMFGVADLSVAVANALPAVRKAADAVIGPNGDDAVARFVADCTAQKR